ncbi:MAG TPA: TonB-dependent receptor [Sphingomonas sp.]|nr:TonB-dependent receptor [Sphingomonas sp.]
MAAVQPALAQNAIQSTVAPTPSPAPGKDIVVTGRLDAARASISPSLGATSYGVSNAAIQALPGGDNQPLNDIVLQLPGVTQDGGGQFHVRDDHNNLQYRINGAILPEGVSVFGQTLSPKLVDRFDLKTGALPAQYGLRTAGIIDITTKSGFANGGEVSLYGGSHATIQPSIDYGGSTGDTDIFVTGSYKHSNLGIEAVDPHYHQLHDATDQYQAFGYLQHTFDAGNRLSLLAGYSDQAFRIPNPRGLHPDSGYDVGGVTDIPSDDLDQRQHERTAFGIASFLHDAGALTLQASLFARFSQLDYRPDDLGELLFNGIAQRATKKDFAAGGQLEAAYRLGPAHTLRGGVVISRDHGISDTSSRVFPVDAAGNQTGQPITVIDNGAATEWTYSAYLQDEWKIAPDLTLNYGARFDHYDAYRSEQQLSPRVNAVWQRGGTTVHAGYARYFSPPPFSNVATTSIARFAGTSAAAPNAAAGDTTPFAERQDYVDVGVQQQLGAVTLGIDGYHRRSKNLIDEGQFGAPIILTPFNYARGRIDGVEFNASYARGPWNAYANFAIAKAQGKDIASGQFNFDAEDLAYIRDHYIYLDHDQTYTGSGGVSYKFAGGTQIGMTMLYGSGLRRDGDVPNGGKMPAYAVFNLTASHRFAGPGIEIRADVTNLFDHVYEIRDGSGIGVGAPQYGERRGVFFGVSKSF